MSDRRSARRFNLFDAVLVLICLLAVIGVWQRPNLEKLFSVDEVLEEYTVTFEVKKMRATTVEMLREDTAFYVEQGDEQLLLGTLAGQVAAAAAKVELYDREGNLVEAVYPQDEYEYLLDVKGTLRCEGIERGGSFLAGGKFYLAYNKTVQVTTEEVDLVLVITGIEKVG